MDWRKGFCRERGRRGRRAGGHLVVEEVEEAKHAVLIIGICLIHVLQQLNLIQALVQVVLVVLRAPRMSPLDAPSHPRLRC